MVALAIGLVLQIVAGVLLFVRRSQRSKLLEIISTDTSTAADLAETARYVAEQLGEAGSFHQVAEVKGLVRCDAPLTSEIARQSCVYYSMSVSREYEESYWDTDPRTKTRVRRTRRGSDTVASNSQRIPFWVEDSTGRIQVDPNDAEIDSVQAVDRFDPAERASGGVVTFGSFSIDVGGILSGAGSGSRTLGYRFRESLLPLDRRVYVLGEASDFAGELSIRKSGDKGRRFIISLKSEDELVRSTRSTIQWLLVGSIGSAALGVLLILVGVAGLVA